MFEGRADRATRIIVTVAYVVSPPWWFENVFPPIPSAIAVSIPAGFRRIPCSIYTLIGGSG